MKTSIALMDLDNPKLTMRDIITAMSRPTKGSDLRLMEPKQQHKILSDIESRQDILDLRKRVADLKNRRPSERPTPSRVGR